jgi:hypothetical protein
MDHILISTLRKLVILTLKLAECLQEDQYKL